MTLLMFVVFFTLTNWVTNYIMTDVVFKERNDQNA
jgi:hypothetical protein